MFQSTEANKPELGLSSGGACGYAGLRYADLGACTRAC
jgi:hypothetical protein